MLRIKILMPYFLLFNICICINCSFPLRKVQAGTKRNIMPAKLQFAGSFRFLEHDVGILVGTAYLKHNIYSKKQELSESIELQNGNITDRIWRKDWNKLFLEGF